MTIHLSAEDVDLAISMLTRLKDASVDEKQDSRAFWQSQYPTRSLSGSQNDSSPTSDSAFYTSLQRIYNVVDPLLSALDSVMDSALISAEHPFLYEGLRRLPDEVLALTFHWASSTNHCVIPSLNNDDRYVSGTTIYRLMRISHVCRRFRSVVLSSPSLCASLDTRVPVPLLWMFINRAGLTPLTVHLVELRSLTEKEKPRNDATLHLILQQRARWRDVFIRIDDWTGPLAGVLRHSEKLQLPLLRYVCFLGPFLKSYRGGNRALPRADFLSTWEYPPSVRIERQGTAPVSVSPSLLHATSLDVDLRDRSSVTDFTHDLTCMDRLDRLEIDCEDPYADNARKPISSTPGSRVDWLAKLTDLSFNIMKVDSPKKPHAPNAPYHLHESVPSTLPVIEMNFIDIAALLPTWRLTKLIICCQKLHSFQSIVAHVGVLENLEVLELDLLEDEDGGCNDIDMEKWCDALPKLKSIAFSGNLPQPNRWLNPATGDFVFKRLDGLREIRLHQCEGKLEGRRLVVCVAEVVAKAWTVAFPGSSTKKVLLIYDSGARDESVVLRLQGFGLDMAWL